MIVMKFGGTSVGNAERYRQVATLISHYLPQRPVVVVSAMGGVTDWLLNTARSLTALGCMPDVDCPTAENLMEGFRAEQQSLLAKAILKPELRQQVEQEVLAYLKQLTRLLTGIELLGELSPRSLDAVAAYGEKLSSKVLAGVLRDIGVKALAVNAEEIVKTDRNFQAARPLMDKTAENCRNQLLPLVEQGTIPVVTGFIGTTEDGITTTLGRDGTDYSASIIGAALDAEEVWIWKEVDGVMTADPRLVGNARSLRRISYAEAGELTYFGAKVIHPLTVGPVVQKNIPIYIKNTFNTDFTGTRIDNEHSVTDGVVKAVTSARNQALISVSGGGVLSVPGIAARTFSRVAERDINVLLISNASSGHDLCFVIEKQYAAEVSEALRKEFAAELERHDIETVETNPDIATIAVVGAGMRGAPGISGRLFSALGRKGINVMVIAQGSSELNISLIIAAADEKRAINTIHDEFLSLTGLGKSISRSQARAESTEAYEQATH